MATCSNSPRVRAADPATPIHSPHHSVHSSSSSRLSVRNLTLHEYRKLQNSPASQPTPPGKSLRRKPAASGLNEVARVPSTSRTPLSTSRPPPRPLHLSQSTHQLFTYQQLPPSPPHQQHDLSPEQLFRSQSAEPSGRHNTAEKERKFKPIKRLPKPVSSTGLGPLPSAPAPLASVTSKQLRLSPLRTTSFPSFDDSTGHDSQTTPSSLSLSRFPQPPNLVDPSFSPPPDEDELPRINTASFTSTAPETPPATPAVVHYRGASFDLVNPHSSLVLDNIETPIRDFDSSDYLPLRSSEDVIEFAEMAPKRGALYGDLSSAYESILVRRGEENPSPLNTNLPLPPTPVAQSPGLSPYTSPFQSPESDVAGSPFSEPKPSHESRFSLKQLTRSLTQKFSKAPEKVDEQELQVLSRSPVSPASPSFSGEFPRPLDQSYPVVAQRSTASPEEPSMPVSPFDRPVHVMDQRLSAASVEQSRFPTQRHASAPLDYSLTSMVPDDPSTKIGQASHVRPLDSGADSSTRPYYDDLASIYPSSSIYTSDSRRQSKYASDRSSSNPYRSVGGGADALAREYKSDAMLAYPFPSSRHTSHRISRPLGQAIFQPTLHQGTEKTDTISRFIDQYKQNEGSDASQSLLSETQEGDAAQQVYTSDEVYGTTQPCRPDNSRASSSLSQFNFDFGAQPIDSNESVAVKPTLAPHPGLPPSVPAPLAPPFEYDDVFESSERSIPSVESSKSPSYGDTRQLLQFSQPVIQGNVPMPAALQPSSSYSQSDAPPGSTPQEALEQADEIFAEAVSHNATSRVRSGSIPAMWSRRVSNHALRNKSDGSSQKQEEEDPSSELASYEDEPDIAEWETVVNSPHRDFRASVGESLADYSSSEGSRCSRDSMGFSGSFPVYAESPLAPGTSQYRHPTPMRSHSNPFTSSPPPLGVPAVAYDRFETPLPSSPPASVTVPELYGSSSSARQDILAVRPWASPYEFSDKETQELLASGPNDEIIYDEDEEADQSHLESREESGPMQPMRITIPTETTMGGHHDSFNLPRDNTFDKLTIIGPKGNLTGTPHGTGMHDAGSSVADNSSPGADLQSTNPSPASTQSPYQVFMSAATRNANVQPNVPAPGSSSSVSHGRPGYFDIAERRGSVNRIVPQIRTPPDSHGRIPSRAILVPQGSPLPGPDRRPSRYSLRSPITPSRPRQSSRSAVPGQTKLRQMVLAPSIHRSSSSGHGVNDSRVFGTVDSGRPSTSNTHTPLRNPTITMRAAFATEDSPHLLCPERAMDPEIERQRRKLSWIIFGVFCILPPTLILYRWMGDLVIVNWTDGRIRQVAPGPKRIALGAGIAANVGLILIILLPILIAHAAGSV